MLPHEIEQESFRIIRSELGSHDFDERQLAACRARDPRHRRL